MQRPALSSGMRVRKPNADALSDRDHSVAITNGIPRRLL
jgi:hypothetical protein